jgi:hypothetical protein
MPENPAGLGFEAETLVHFSKMLYAVPYERYYHNLRTKPGWTGTGFWHLPCQCEIFVNADTEICGCGSGPIDLARPITKNWIIPE